MPHSPEGQGQFSVALTPYPALPMHYLCLSWEKELPLSKLPPVRKMVAVLSEQYECQQASLAFPLSRWNGVQAAALPSEGAPLWEVFVPFSLGKNYRQAGLGRMVPFAGVGSEAWVHMTLFFFFFKEKKCSGR